MIHWLVDNYRNIRLLIALKNYFFAFRIQNKSSAKIYDIAPFKVFGDWFIQSKPIW